MSRNTATILGGVLGGIIISALMMSLAYLVAGFLSWGNVAPAMLSGVVFAILYPLIVMKGGR